MLVLVVVVVVGVVGVPDTNMETIDPLPKFCHAHPYSFPIPTKAAAKPVGLGYHKGTFQNTDKGMKALVEFMAVIVFFLPLFPYTFFLLQARYFLP